MGSTRFDLSSGNGNNSNNDWRHNTIDPSNMNLPVRGVGQTFLDNGSALHEPCMGGYEPAQPKDERGGGGSSTTSRRHSVSAVHPGGPPSLGSTPLATTPRTSQSQQLVQVCSTVSSAVVA